MSWVFLVGLAFDGVGALLIAWPILRPGSAAREAARPRYEGDHWASFRRERELRLVQYGALALAFGFSLQAAAYVIRLGDWWWLALAIVVVIMLLGLAVATAFARRGLPKHVWYPVLRPADQIGDGLRVYGVSNTRDLEAVLRRSLRGQGIDVGPIEQRSRAFVESGIWTANCPRCHQPTAATTPAWGQAICTECGAQYGVDYPDAQERREIEAEIIAEPDPTRRRWVG